MYKTLAILLLISVVGIAGNTAQFPVQSKYIQRDSFPTKSGNVGLDFCPDCVEVVDQLITVVLDVILQYGVMDSCGKLCDLVTEKSGSALLGFICTMGCDFLGLEEFAKLMEDADINPIYYCEKMNFCPINDNGDCSFQSFAIVPARAQTESTISINMDLKTINGTGTGEIVLMIHAVDNITLGGAFLFEAKKPGSYAERFSISTVPDPDCDLTAQKCEEWLEGTYNVTVMVCNGQCGSHHPHTSIYAVAKGNFTLYEET